MRKTLLRLVGLAAPLLVASSAMAQDVAAEGITSSERAWAYVAAAIGLAIAAFGGALGQGKAASSALDGIARNPNASDKLFTPMILGLALIESLVIYSLVIGIMLVTKF